MSIFAVVGSIALSIFSTAVMSYISMATPIGPWIAPTIALIAILFSRLLLIRNSARIVGYITAGSSIGGILATAAGFSFPTLYFLDPSTFYVWLASPSYFAFILAGLSFIAGSIGLFMGAILERKLIHDEKLSFPIGQLVFKMIAAGNQIKKAYELMIGFFSTTLFCLLQDGIYRFHGFLPKNFMLFPPFSYGPFAIPLIRFDIWPMLWAIGFVTGHVIAIPLAVGALSKIFLIDTAHTVWFAHISATEFVLAFCSGMVLYGATISFLSLPSLLKRGANGWREQSWLEQVKDYRILVGGSLMACLGGLYLRFFGFSFPAMLFLYAASIACIYQIAIIAGKIGLAPLGRFATFVMVPAMLLFGMDMVQTVFVATFVEMACGVAADVLFGRKMASLLELDHWKVTLFQLLGLLVSSASLGIIFWYLITHFHLGSAELFAYKAQSRALLIDVKNFDYWALLLGALYSAGLKRAKVNPMLVLGGLLMPINISLGLIFGGFLTSFAKNREDWEPFWSGVFAANSMWMLLRAMIS